MWPPPAGVDLSSSALWGPASTSLTLLQSEGKVSVVSLPFSREQLGKCSLY